MKVQLLVSMATAQGVLKKGQELELRDTDAVDLIEAGYAKLVEEKAPPRRRRATSKKAGNRSKR